MATTYTYSITYSNGYTPPGGQGISITIPSTYSLSSKSAIKWACFLHGWTDNGLSMCDTSYMRGKVEDKGMAVVAINCNTDLPWMDGSSWGGYGCDWVREGIALALSKCPSLCHYLPMLVGMSAGTMGALFSLKKDPLLYSGAALTSSLTDLLAAADANGLDAAWYDVFLGPHDSANQTIVNRWKAYSAYYSYNGIGTGLQGRLIGLWQGANDTTCPISVQVTPFWGNVPSGNKHNNSSVSGAGHDSFFTDSGYSSTADLIWTFISDHSILTPYSNLAMTM
jgi:hypothetical protein